MSIFSKAASIFRRDPEQRKKRLKSDVEQALSKTVAGYDKSTGLYADSGKTVPRQQAQAAKKWGKKVHKLMNLDPIEGYVAIYNALIALAPESPAFPAIPETAQKDGTVPGQPDEPTQGPESAFKKAYADYCIAMQNAAEMPLASQIEQAVFDLVPRSFPEHPQPAMESTYNVLVFLFGMKNGEKPLLRMLVECADELPERLKEMSFDEQSLAERGPKYWKSPQQALTFATDALVATGRFETEKSDLGVDLAQTWHKLIDALATAEGPLHPYEAVAKQVYSADKASGVYFLIPHYKGIPAIREGIRLILIDKTIHKNNHLLNGLRGPRSNNNGIRVITVTPEDASPS